MFCFFFLRRPNRAISTIATLSATQQGKPPCLLAWSKMMHSFTYLDIFIHTWLATCGRESNTSCFYLQSSPNDKEFGHTISNEQLVSGESINSNKIISTVTWEAQRVQINEEPLYQWDFITSYTLVISRIYFWAVPFQNWNRTSRPEDGTNAANDTNRISEEISFTKAIFPTSKSPPLVLIRIWHHRLHVTLTGLERKPTVLALHKQNI